MNLITKLAVLNSTKFPNQVLKNFTTTHKNHVPLIYHADYRDAQNRSRSLPCRALNSFGPIELLQRSISPNPYLIRRAQISYMCNKLDVMKEWQKQASKNSRTSFQERKLSTTLIKKQSKTNNNNNSSVPNRKFSKLKDVIRNIFGKKPKASDIPVDKFEDPMPNMKMKIVPYSSGRTSTRVEITQVNLEEQGRRTPKIPYLYDYQTSQIDVKVRPMSYYGDVENKKTKHVKPPVKNAKTSENKSKSKIVEVICPDVEDSVEGATTKKAKYIPFQNMNETVIEPKVDKKSQSTIVSVADICKEVDKNFTSRRRRENVILSGDKKVVSYLIKKSSSSPSKKKKKKGEMIGKAKSLVVEEKEDKIKMSNFWTKPKPRGPSGLPSKPAKVEPCDPYKDSKRKLSNVSYNESNLTKLSYGNSSIPCEAGTNFAERKPGKVEPCDPCKDSKRKLSNASNLTKSSYGNYSTPCEAGTNFPERKPTKAESCDHCKDSKRELSNASNLTKLSYENYSIPCEADTNFAERDIFSMYESSDSVAMENIAELRKHEGSLKAPRSNILSQNKALATSHIDMLNTQLLCSNLFSSCSSKQFSENLQPFHIKSYLTQPNYDLSDLGILNSIVAHDKEKRKAEWEKYKSDIYNLKTIEKTCKSKLYKDHGETEHKSTVLMKLEEEESAEKNEEPKEEPKKVEATTKNKDGKNSSSSKPITFIKKDFHTLSSSDSYANRRLENEANSISYSTKSRKDGRGRRKVVYIADKELKKPEPCTIDEIIKRAKMKQGRSIMRHTEWKAVPIRGMKDPAKERQKIREEREKYKELIRIRSNSRETKEPEICIHRTPFDEEEEEPKKKPKLKKPKTLPSIETPNNFECRPRTSTKVVFTRSSNSIDDCGCVGTLTRKPPAWSNEIMDPRENLKCVQKKCRQTEECKRKLRQILHEIEESSEKLKKFEKLKRKNKNYNSNCDTIRSRNLRK